ncbi:MAG: hypothetical protein M1812_003375 [Candelaria pacifica]|nr:MAG: hypothetical protein M1812_003375 [Candelaria pacifica]
MKSTIAVLSILISAAVFPGNSLPIPVLSPFSEQERSEIDALRLRGVSEADVYARMSEGHKKYDCRRGAKGDKSYGCRQFALKTDYASELLGDDVFGRSQQSRGKVELRNIDEDLNRYEERRKRMIIR